MEPFFFGSGANAIYSQGQVESDGRTGRRRGAAETAGGDGDVILVDGGDGICVGGAVMEHLSVEPR